jgi:hypothetical protein
VDAPLFLLRFVSSVEIRRTIRAETTKIESFNEFLDWVSFGIHPGKIAWAGPQRPDRPQLVW